MSISFVRLVQVHVHGTVFAEQEWQSMELYRIRSQGGGAMFEKFSEKFRRADGELVVLDIHTTSPATERPSIVRNGVRSENGDGNNIVNGEMFERARRIFYRGKINSNRATA